MNDEILDQEKIAKFIATNRKKKKYTQEQLGEIIGVSAKSISKWENGHALPDIGLFPKLAKVLGVSIADLFAGEIIINENEEKITLINDASELLIKNNNKRIMRKVIKWFTIFLFIILLFFGGYLYYDNYYKYKVYSLSVSEKEFYINGYLIQNVDHTILSIKSISYIDTSIGTIDEKKVSSVEVEITSSGRLIESNSIPISVNSEEYLSEVLNRGSAFIEIKNNEEENRNINIEDLYMTIKYISNGKIETIDLKIIGEKN